MTTRSLFGILLVALLIAPYLILVSFMPNAHFAWPAGAWRVIGFTFEQAVLSAMAALVFGGVAAAGLLSRERSRAVFEAAALSVNAMPVLFVVIGTLNVIPSLSGMGGIVFVHTLLNTGLVAVSLSRLWLEKIGRLSELAAVEGAGRWLFIRHVVAGLLANDLALIALFVFLLSWTSFAVPLLIGGSRATTFEVLIYENIQAYSTWPQALWLSLTQTIFIFSISWPLKRTDIQTVSRFARIPHLEWSPGLLVVIAPLILMLASFARGLILGWDTLWIQIMTGELMQPLLASVGVAFVTGGLTLALLLFVSAIFPENRLRQFLVGYLSPGAVLSGFALLIVWRATGIATFFKISVGLGLLFLPAFYRLRWDQLLGGLRGQVTVARTMGASRSLIFFDLVVPQVWPQACRLAGLAAVWAWGDFALSSVVSEREVTLALVARGLVGSYRIENAAALVWVILLGASLTYLIFEGLSYVGRPRA